MKEDRIISIVCYITLVGWIVSLILYSSDPKFKSSLSRFHLKQALGLIILAFAASIIFRIIIHMPFFGWLTAVILGPIFAIFIIVLLVMGIINASQGEEKPLPLIGRFADENLNFIN